MQFIDLGAQRAKIHDRLKAAVERVVEGGRYILGPEVAANRWRDSRQSQRA